LHSHTFCTHGSCRTNHCQRSDQGRRVQDLRAPGQEIAPAFTCTPAIRGGRIARESLHGRTCDVSCIRLPWSLLGLRSANKKGAKKRPLPEGGGLLSTLLRQTPSLLAWSTSVDPADQRLYFFDRNVTSILEV